VRNINVVVITGNLTRDPELKKLKSLPSGSSVCELGVAVNESTKNPDGTWGERANFFNVEVFGKQAEACAQYLAKGRPVAIEGRLRFRSWTAQDGSKRSAVSIVAESVQFLGSKEAAPGSPAHAPVGEDVPVDDFTCPF
jgi:single-strand DNA-binding protein